VDDRLACREDRLLAELRTTLGELDPPVLQAMGAALARDRDRLVGGDWGVDDGEGCLLTLAARELGRERGEDLLVDCVAAVRVPVLLDEAWAVLLARGGSATAAREVVCRVVEDAVALRPAQATGTSLGASASDDRPREARIARAR
jgi:hypothetical protein